MLAALAGNMGSDVQLDVNPLSMVPACDLVLLKTGSVRPSSALPSCECAASPPISDSSVVAVAVV
jgi:hypothetical protein